MAFVIAIGMAFATTPINGFETEVWMKENEEDEGCEVTLCSTIPGPPCNQSGLFYSDKDCEHSVPTVYLRTN